MKNDSISQRNLVTMLLIVCVILLLLLTVVWIIPYLLAIALTVLLQLQLILNNAHLTKTIIPKFISTRIAIPTSLPPLNYLVFAVTFYLSLLISFLVTLPLIMFFGMLLWSFGGDSHPPPIYALVLVLGIFELIVLGVNFITTHYSSKFANRFLGIVIP